MEKLIKVSPLLWQDENGHIYSVQELFELGFQFVNGNPVLPPKE